MRLGIFGRGRLAQAVAAAAREAGVDLAWSLGRGEEPEGPVDLALDASAGPAVAGHLQWAMETGTSLAIGATGWDRAILEGPRALGKDLPLAIMVAPNFSLGVAFMRRAALTLGRFSALEPGADLGLLERHHRAKKDSPSGTAKLLGEALAQGNPRYAPSGPAALSFRLGSEVGYHELRLEADFETIVFSHEAKDRALFGRGALGALAWLQGRRGIYSFDDYAREIIEPLFTSPQGGSHD